MLWQLHSETGDVGEGSKVCRNTQCLFTQTQLGRERGKGREAREGGEGGSEGGREGGRGGKGRKLSESFTKV